MLHNQVENWTREGGFTREGETVDEPFADTSDLRDVYEINMKGIQELWNKGDFDVLAIASEPRIKDIGKRRRS